MSEAKERLKAAAFTISNKDDPYWLDVPVVSLADAVREIETLEVERDAMEARLVDLALELAAHVTAEDRKQILASEDVRSIMDLRLR